jgi:hypothetical protein
MVGQDLEGLDAITGQPQGPGVRQDDRAESPALGPQGKNQYRSGSRLPQRFCADKATA